MRACVHVLCGIPEDTAAGVSVHTLPAVADPGLAEVTDGAHHHHPSGVGSCSSGHHNDMASCHNKLTVLDKYLNKQLLLTRNYQRGYPVGCSIPNTYM